VPTDPESFARYYTVDARDLALIRTKRGERIRLGYAVQLAYLPLGRLKRPRLVRDEFPQPQFRDGRRRQFLHRVLGVAPYRVAAPSGAKADKYPSVAMRIMK
jgi:hypothetical protein